MQRPVIHTRASSALLTAVALLAVPALAQSSGEREPYRNAFERWSTLDQNLEADAATPTPAFSIRVRQAAAAAEAFTNARGAYLGAKAEESQQQQAWLEESAPPSTSRLATGPEFEALLDSVTGSVTRVLNSLAGDSDAAIARWRAALEAERTALNELSGALAGRQEISRQTTAMTAILETERATSVEALAEAVTTRVGAAQSLENEGAAWATYYELLDAGSKAPLVTEAAPPRVTSSNGTPGASIAPVPLARYVGGWTFPENGLFFGFQPQFVDLVVHEENGQVDGTLYGRFTLPAGSTADPVLRFDFQGPLQATRTQTFTLQTNAGAMGTIDLIPGPAFNLLEVNFRTDPDEASITTGNFVVLKK